MSLFYIWLARKMLPISQNIYRTSRELVIKGAILSQVVDTTGGTATQLYGSITLSRE